MLKCSSERWVCAPHSLSAGTLTSPRLSVSLRTSATGFPLLNLMGQTHGWGRATGGARAAPKRKPPIDQSFDGLARSDLSVP